MCTGAIRRNPPTKSSTDSEIKAVIVKYLRGAGDRNGGRKARLEKAKAKKKARLQEKKEKKRRAAVLSDSDK